MTKYWLLGMALGVGLFSCGEPKVREYPDPSSLAVPTQVGGITAYVLKPSQTSIADNATQDIEIAAYTEDAASLEVSISKVEPDATGKLRSIGIQVLETHGVPGPEQRFTGRIPLIHGPNRVEARIQTSDKSKVRSLDFTLEYFGQAPGATLAVAEPSRGDATAADACKEVIELQAPPTTRRNVVCVHGRITTEVPPALLAANSQLTEAPEADPFASLRAGTDAQAGSDNAAGTGTAAGERAGGDNSVGTDASNNSDNTAGGGTGGSNPFASLEAGQGGSDSQDTRGGAGSTNNEADTTSDNPFAPLLGGSSADTGAAGVDSSNSALTLVKGNSTALTLSELTAQVVLGGQTQVVTLDENGYFAVPVTLSPNTVNTIELQVGGGGRNTSAQYTLRQDSTPPSINLPDLLNRTPEIVGSEYVLRGEVRDDSGIADVSIQSPDGAYKKSLGAITTIQETVQLTPGQNDLVVLATDLAGNEARSPISIVRVRTVLLGPQTPDVGTTEISLDRDQLSELLSDSGQMQLTLAEVDLTSAIQSALHRIRDPQNYGVDDSQWGVAEKNMQRILRLTTDVADLSGTSVEELLDIAGSLGLPVWRVLADLLEIKPTDYIVDADAAASVLLNDLIATHPNIAHNRDGKPVLAITLYDVLQNLTTLVARFGPAGDHPGFLAGESRGNVLEPGFLMTLPVHSNLVQYDAIDLWDDTGAAAKKFLFLVHGDRALDFNILTDQFAIVGLVDQPTVDLQLVIQESDTAPRAGSDRTANPDPADAGFSYGNGQAFQLPPWLFEHIVADIAYSQLHRRFASNDFKHNKVYNAGSIMNAATLDWDHGWVTIQAVAGLGNPPPPLYAWDLLNEVAQVRLHDQGLAEGEADLQFTLDRLPIGLSADQLTEILRPTLAGQEGLLSSMLVGSSSLAKSTADIFFAVPEDGGDGALVFRAPGDSGENIDYPHPGFFADEALTQKLSSTDPGYGLDDNVHEKLTAAPGTYFAEDAEGHVRKLVVEKTEDGVSVRVCNPADPCTEAQ